MAGLVVGTHMRRFAAAVAGVGLHVDTTAYMFLVPYKIGCDIVIELPAARSRMWSALSVRNSTIIFCIYFWNSDTDHHKSQLFRAFSILRWMQMFVFTRWRKVRYQFF